MCKFNKHQIKNPEARFGSSESELLEAPIWSCRQLRIGASRSSDSELLRSSELELLTLFKHQNTEAPNRSWQLQFEPGSSKQKLQFGAGSCKSELEAPNWSCSAAPFRRCQLRFGAAAPNRSFSEFQGSYILSRLLCGRPRALRGAHALEPSIINATKRTLQAALWEAARASGRARSGRL